MKKILLLSFLFILTISDSYAQWSIISVGTGQPLYSVDFHTLNNIWIGSYNEITTTSNGGTSWLVEGNTMIDTSGTYIVPAAVQGIRVLSPTSGLATGILDNGNKELILLSTNSGYDWHEPSINTTLPTPRYIESLDMSSSRVVAVGSNGRIGVSNNSGSSWTFMPSGTSNLINDVQFASYDTIFAGGQNILLKSFDGGLTWIDSTISGNILCVRCCKSAIYLSTSSGILKSVDYGKSYSKVILPFINSGAIAVISEDTIIAAGPNGLYVSETGGQYWEQYKLSSYPGVNMISLYNSHNAIAVGNSGYAIKTANLPNCPSLPVVKFSTQSGSTAFCTGDSITLIDSTPNMTGYTYQWKLNGTLFSTQYNTGIRINTAGKDTISLTVTSSTGSVTLKLPITVTGHFSFTSMVIKNSEDTVCNGNMEVFSLLNSQTGASYQLRLGSTKIGSAQSGTGGALNFVYSTKITTKEGFNIKALSITTCYTDSIISYDTINVHSSVGEPPAICTPGSAQCSFQGIGSMAFGTINNGNCCLVGTNI